jgi:hypothetical protein
MALVLSVCCVHPHAIAPDGQPLGRLRRSLSYLEAPASRIAIACRRFLTLPPRRLFSSPCLNSRITLPVVALVLNEHLLPFDLPQLPGRKCAQRLEPRAWRGVSASFHLIEQR